MQWTTLKGTEEFYSYMKITEVKSKVTHFFYISVAAELQISWDGEPSPVPTF